MEVPATALVSTIMAGAIAGLPIAVYFTASFYWQDRSPALARFARVCNTEHGTCLALLRTPYARVFGLPNSLLGIGYYVLLIAWSVGALLTGQGRFPGVVAVIATFAGLFSVFLIWALVKRLRSPCPL